MMKVDYTLDDVLSWVNQIRAEHKIGGPLNELPKGVRWSGDRCVIGRAIEGYASFFDCYPGHDWSVGVEYPEFITTFVKDFDDGRIPELDEDAA